MHGFLEVSNDQISTGIAKISFDFPFAVTGRFEAVIGRIDNIRPDIDTSVVRI